MRGTRRRSGSHSEAKGAASTGVVFAVLAVTVVLVAGAALLLMPDPAETPTPATSPTGQPSSPDLSLTDEEAIERFRELDTLRRRAIESRTPSLLADAFATGSPAGERAENTIKKLRRDDVTMEAVHYEEQTARVIRNAADRIIIRQVVELETRFFDARGRDVTTSGRRELQTIEWVLLRSANDWLLFDATITDAVPVDA